MKKKLEKIRYKYKMYVFDGKHNRVKMLHGDDKDEILNRYNEWIATQPEDDYTNLIFNDDGDKGFKGGYH